MQMCTYDSRLLPHRSVIDVGAASVAAGVAGRQFDRPTRTDGGAGGQLGLREIHLYSADTALLRPLPRRGQRTRLSRSVSNQCQFPRLSGALTTAGASACRQVTGGWRHDHPD